MSILETPVESFTRQFLSHQAMFKKSSLLTVAFSLARFFFIVSPGLSQQLQHYEIDVEILPDEEILQAQATVSLTAPEEGLSRLEFFLNDRLEITTLRVDSREVPFQKDITRKGSAQYSRPSVPVVVTFEQPLDAGKILELQVNYQGGIEGDPWTTNRLTKDWIELGMYCAWFPLFVNSWGFTYEIDLTIDPAYMITGTGKTSFSDGHWHLIQTDKTGDIVVMGGPKMKRSDIGDGTSEITIYHSGLKADQVEQIAIDSDRILKNFASWFGAKPLSDLTIALAPRSMGGGYARPGLIVMSYENDPAGYPWLVKSLAHEFAHFWWSGASTADWEDWLNESFAEYASLMFVRDLYGAEAFQKYLDEFRTKAENTPAIRGIDRRDQQAYIVLYMKGALLLYELEQRIGQEAFLSFLQTIIKEKIHSTEPLLARLEVMTSPETRAWFDQGLSR